MRDIIPMNQRFTYLIMPLYLFYHFQLFPESEVLPFHFREWIVLRLIADYTYR